MKNEILIICLTLFISFSLPAQQLNDQSNESHSDSVSNASIKSKVPVFGYTGSYHIISESEFNRGLILRPEEIFQGRIPGMNSFSANGMPGVQHNLFYRGSNLSGSNNNPLILVDNFPVSAGLLTLNPGDIREVSFLSGGIAATLYGSEASWGVIMINTHRNSRKFSLTYKTTAGISVLPEKVENFSAAEIKKLSKPYLGFNQELDRQIGDADTDWQDAIVRTAAGQDHYISVSGNTLTIPWQASAGYNSTNGIIETTGYKRLNTAIQARPEFFKNHLKLEGSLFIHNAESRTDPNNAFKSAVLFNPTLPVFEDNEYGGYFYYKEGDGSIKRFAPVNPLALLMQTDSRTSNEGMIANYGIQYKLHFFPSLKLGVRGNYRQAITTHTKTPHMSAAWVEMYNSFGVTATYKNNAEERFFEPYILYARYFQKLKSNISFTAGYRAQDKEFHSSEFSHSKGDSTRYSSWGKDLKKTFYSMLNMEFLNRYSVSLSLMNETSSMFKNVDQEKLSPGFGAVWNIKQEPLLGNLKVLNGLEAFYSYSRIHAAWIYSTSYKTISNSDDGTQPFGNYHTPIHYSPNLRPEIITQSEAGFRFQMLNHRISGSLVFYKKKYEHELMIIPVAGIENSLKYYLVNAADIENKGLEINFNSVIISQGKFNVQAGINLAFNERTVASLPGFVDFLVYENINQGIGNHIMILKEGYAPNSFYVYSQMYDGSGKPIEGVFTNFAGQTGSVYGNEANRYICGKSDPNLVASLQLVLKYSAFRLGIAARMNKGHSIYNQLAASSYWSGIAGWGGRFITNIPKLVENSDFNNPWFYSDYYVEDASFLRIDNVNLSYTFNKIAGLDSKLEIEAAVQNAFLTTGYTGIDPETTNGIDFLNYPRPRIYSLSLKFGI